MGGLKREGGGEREEGSPFLLLLLLPQEGEAARGYKGAGRSSPRAMAGFTGSGAKPWEQREGRAVVVGLPLGGGEGGKSEGKGAAAAAAAGGRRGQSGGSYHRGVPGATKGEKGGGAVLLLESPATASGAPLCALSSW